MTPSDSTPELRHATARPADAASAARRCRLLFERGEHLALRSEAAALLPLLAAADGADGTADRFEGMRMVSIACLETGAFDEALDLAQRMRQEAEANEDSGRMLQAAFALATSLERLGDPWQAMRILEQALEIHGGTCGPRERLVALNGLCAVGIGTLHRLGDTMSCDERRTLLGRAAEAGAAARALIATADLPVYEVAVLGNLGEVLMHRGELSLATELLQRAHALALQRGLRAHRWRIAATLGDWLLANDRGAEALEAMRELLAEMGEPAPLSTALRANHVAYRAAKRLSRVDDALRHLERFEQLERSRAVHQLKAQSELFVTRAEAQKALQQAEQARAAVQHERRRAAEYQRRAEHDALTGLGNRRYLDRRMAELLPGAAALQQPLVLALIDLDRFKSVNDDLGHPSGDRVLVDLAQLLRDSVRDADVLARLGGEEFVVVLPGLELERAHEICERLRLRVRGHRFDALPPGRHLTASIGLAGAPGYDAADLMHRADQALYAAKAAGRDRVVTGGLTA